MLENYNDILTLQDLREILQIGKNTALALIHDGDIEAFMIKGRWRILKSDVVAYLRHVNYYTLFNPLLSIFCFFVAF